MSQDIQTQYQAALDYIYEYVDFSLTHQDDLSIEDFTLQSMRNLMKSLGQPDHTYPSIHVAGTKGKGSVCAFCAHALRAQGYKVGLYTSPHLKDFEERIQINGVSISQEEFVDLVEKIKPHVAAIPDLTTFHITTAMALWYFALNNVDVAVVEVGLGGRLDSTNVISPVLTVITSLYLEHTKILGDTIEEIAAEKAGIIKPGVPVVVASQVDSAIEVIEAIAENKEAPLTLIGRDYHYQQCEHSLDGQELSIWNGGKPPANYQIELLGPHQAENAVVAYATLQLANDVGIVVDDESIQEGFAKTEWPGRFEILRKEPPVVVDSGHTPGAMMKIQQTMDEYFPGRSLWLILGASDDKDIHGMLKELTPRLKKVYCAKSTHPRAMDPAALASMANGVGVPIEIIPDVGDALEMAMAEAPEGDVIMVTGSIFVAATGRIAWFERKLGE